MIIAISGTPGSGKSSIAKFIAKKLRLKLYTVGEMARKIAMKNGISVEELSKLALKDSTIDREIDSIHKKIHGNFVLDSRIGFHFFPKAVKIFAYCNSNVAAKRIFEAKRPTESMGLKKILNEVKDRNKTDVLRYKKYYGIDIGDLSNYDIVIDTSEMNKTEMNNKVLMAIKKFNA